MKRFYKFLLSAAMIMALTVPWTARSQDTVTIGTGTSTTSNTPFSSLWGYSFVEQIYPGTAIGTAGQITAVQFYLGQSYSSAQTNNITLYMKNVTRSSFSSVSDYEPVTTSDIVYSGTWTIPASYTGWVEIELDSPFDYDGSSNLMVAMHEFTSGYSTRYFRYTDATNSGVRYYSDSDDPNPYNLTSYSGYSAVISTLANMRLAITAGDVTCNRVRNVSASNIGPWSCTLSWVDTLNSNATYTIVDMADSTVLATGITDTTYDLTDLISDHSYNFGVFADCGGGDESGYARITVHTLVSCPNPTALTVDSAAANELYIHWTPGYDETEWALLVNDSLVDGITDTAYTITDLNASTQYTISLRAVCGAGDTSVATSILARTDCENGSCNIIVMAEDSYGDGWNGNAINVMQGGSLMGSATISSGSNATIPIQVCDGVPVTLTYTSGSYADEMGGTVLDGGGSIIFTISNMNNYSSGATLATVASPCPDCLAPTDLVIDSIAPTEITLHWNAGTSTEWLVGYGDTVVEGINTSSYTITGLEQYTQYSIVVYAICDNGDTSSASLPVTARTTVSCTWPVNLTATATGGDTVMVTWASGANNTSSDYYLVYGPTGFNPATVGESNWIPVNGVTSYEITGLTTGLWDIYVRCDCGGDDGISAWAGPASVGLGYVNIDQVDTLYTCGAVICDNGGPNGVYSTGRNDQVVVYPIDNQHGITVSGISYTESTWDYLYIYEGVGTSGTILWNDNISGSQTRSFGPFDIEGPVTITFHSDASNNYDGFQVSVMCYDLGGCVRPSDLVCTSSTTPDSVAISWNGNGASGWEVFIGPAGAQPDADSAIAVTDSSYVFTNLNGGVAYNVYVRSDCGGEYSDWRGPLAFIPGTYIMSTTGSDTITMCGGVIYDNGGPNEQYSNSCNSTLVVYSTPGNRMTISGSYSGESCCDYLKIFDGVGTTGTPLNTTQYGSFTVGPYTSTTGAFTIQYTSDGSGVGDGYALNIECQSLACPLATEIHAEQVSAGTAILGYTIMGVTDTNTYDDLTLILTSATNTLTLHPTSDNTMVLTGLDSNTTYMAQLFTTCGGMEADTVSCTFTTKALPCAVVDLAQTDTVQIGNGTNTSYYIPIGNYYNYSYTQQLISASEMNGAMNISGIDFQYAYSSPSTVKDNVSIYLANVSQSSLSGSFVPYSNSFTLVYTGAMNCTQGWNHFEFDTPFSYDGTSNLLIVVHDNSGDYDGSSYTFYTHSATGKGRYVQNDGSAYDIQTVSGGTSLDYRANMKLYSFGCVQQATCAAPLVMLDSTTTTTAVVNIYPGYQETSWTVEYRIVGESNWTMSGTATATSYTVTGLQSGKHYEIRVSSVCDSASFGTKVAATTQCAVVAVTPATPYFENFEGGAPVCWSQEYVHGQYNWLLGSETYVYHNSTYQHGEGAAELYQQSNTSDTAITKLITDVFDFTALTNGARLRFYNAQLSYQTYGQPTLYLYYRTADNDDWTVFDSIVTAVTDFTQHQFILPNSTAAPYYQIAFEGHCPYGYGLNVDDVLIDAAPNCSRPIIDTVVANGATATITWTGNANSYTVSYHDFYDTVAPWTTVTVTGTTTTLTGLTTGNYYELTVTGDCGAVDGQSDPSAPAYFYVPCAAQTIPYTENFDSYTNDLCYIANSSFQGFDNYPYVQLPNCWMFPNQSHQGISPAALLFNDSVNAFPSKCLWINARTGRDHYSVLPLMDAPIDTLVLLFDYRLSSETMVVGVVTDPNDITTFVGLDTLTASSGSVEHYFSTDAINWNAGQDYYIAFHTFGSYYAFIDNIEVVYQPHCMKVANLHQVSATSSTVTVDWTNSSTGGTPVAYQISYTAQGSTTPNYIISTAKPATISGLASITSYTVAVRPICGVGDTAFWSDNLQVSTEMCDNVTTVVNYDSTETVYTSGSGYSPIGYSLYDYSFVQIIVDSAKMAALAGSDITAFAFMPLDDSGAEDFNYMDVYLANVSESSLSSGFIVPDTNHEFVQVINNGNFNFTEDDVNTWVIHSFDTTFAWDGHSNVLFTVNRRNGDWSTTSYFAAHSQTGDKMRYAYRDGTEYNFSNVSGLGSTSSTVGDIKFISCGAGCPAPTVSVSNIDAQNATITAIGSGINYELQYGIDPSALTETMSNTTGVFNLSGLAPETQYFYAVRQQCDSTLWSNWYEGAFTTAELGCLAPTGLQATNTDYTSVTLSWTIGNEETAWEVSVINSTNAADTHSVVVNTTTATVNGLQADMDYIARVRALCGADADIEGPWSDSVLVHTVACEAVTGVNVNAGSTTATVTWTATGNSYRVVWGEQPFNPTYFMGEATVTTNSYTISGLEAEMDYAVVVYNNCAEGLSMASGVVNFSTVQGGVDPTMYTITVNSNNPNWGTVEGSGTYAEGTVVTISATANEGYHFEQWHDGNTEATRQITVTSNATYTANFAEDGTVTNYYTVTVTANDPTMGTVSGSGTYAEGSTATISATPNDGYIFEGWADGNTDNPRTVTVTADVTYTANFAVDPNGIDDVVAGTMSLYPNPASTSVTLGLEGFEGEVSIDVVDMNGRVVYSANTTSSTVSIDVNELPQGAYFVRVVSGTQTAVRKLVVK